MCFSRGSYSAHAAPMALLKEADQLVAESNELYSQTFALPPPPSTDSTEELRRLRDEIAALRDENALQARRNEDLQSKFDSAQHALDIESERVQTLTWQCEGLHAGLLNAEGNMQRSLKFVEEVVNSNVTEWLAEISKCSLYHLDKCSRRIDELATYTHAHTVKGKRAIVHTRTETSSDTELNGQPDTDTDDSELESPPAI
eukprot:NODE_7878_length_736_cov_104.017945_g7627_i0.p1 GENE.NODE_7878_length_736_cov_104.017945_g7627_i0~~NODE_7878_length_736_cov_104.017945_g7627_i0.p1  ORF type:complete len:220 (+),score=30.21 NODE_7878_length_736_cov_104.017945_g7627_i0:59-661(+)